MVTKISSENQAMLWFWGPHPSRNFFDFWGEPNWWPPGQRWIWIQAKKTVLFHSPGPHRPRRFQWELEGQTPLRGWNDANGLQSNRPSCAKSEGPRQISCQHPRAGEGMGKGACLHGVCNLMSAAKTMEHGVGLPSDMWNRTLLSQNAHKGGLGCLVHRAYKFCRKEFFFYLQGNFFPASRGYYWYLIWNIFGHYNWHVFVCFGIFS